MYELYPYSSPIILTDSIYADYGGNTGSSTVKQRQAAYWIAERQMTQHLNAFLLPTQVTGAYPIPHLVNPLITSYGQVTSIDAVFFNYLNGYTCQIQQFPGVAAVIQGDYGCIFVHSVMAPCCYGYGYGYPYYIAPYQVLVTYTSGYPSGTSFQPNMLMALTMATTINLNFMSDPGANEGAFDIGIQEFQNQSYREVRVKLGHNAFGTSPAAMKIADLVTSLKHRPTLRMH